MTLVEQVATRTVVSSQHLSHHNWSYGGVDLVVGEIEHVATLTEFRQRGLVRRQTDLMHAWSRQAGELATAINGIPWYYTQFGYDLPLDKHNGRRLINEYAARITADHAPYALRAATGSDLEFIRYVFDAGMRRHLVSTVRNLADWHYELELRDPRSAWYRQLFILVDNDRPVGFISLDPTKHAIDAFEIAPGTPWSSATFSLARWLMNKPDTADDTGAEHRPISWHFSWLGEHHPSFLACPHLFGHSETLGTPFRRGAWYVRIPDVPAFVAHIAPALEQRLSTSNEAGYTGCVKIGRYRQPGVEITIDDGHISVRPWSQRGIHEGDARFADATFVELLFGRTSLADLEHCYPYRVNIDPAIRPVLHALFAPQASYLLPLY